MIGILFVWYLAIFAFATVVILALCAAAKRADENTVIVVETTRGAPLEA